MEKLTRILAVLEHPEDCELLLDKAVLLARGFGARVDILMVDGAQTRNFAKSIATLGYDKVTLTSLHRGGESTCEHILKHLSTSAPDLIVKALTGAHPLRRLRLDANDWELADKCSTPVLLVRRRPWSDPVRIAAAVDVADDEATHIARGILHSAGFLATAGGTLDVLYCEREQEDSALRIERTVKLAQLVREFQVGCERLQVLSGKPEKVLPPLAASRQYDVLVLGAPTHRPGIDAILGGMSNLLIEATEGDVLLVKSAGRLLGETSVPERSSSGREQRADEFEQFV